MNPIEHRARPKTLARAPANKIAVPSRVTAQRGAPRSAPSPGTRPTAMVSSALASARRAAALLARGARAPRARRDLRVRFVGHVIVGSALRPRVGPAVVRGRAARVRRLRGPRGGAHVHAHARNPAPARRTEAPEPSTSGASDEFVFVRVGLADRAFDEIGDVKVIAAVAAAGSRLRRDENVCVLSWEGFKRTASDELYHAVWANASGDRRFAAPFAVRSRRDQRERARRSVRRRVRHGEGMDRGVAGDARGAQSAVRDGDLLSEEKYAEVCDAQEREEDAAASRAYP